MNCQKSENDIAYSLKTMMIKIEKTLELPEVVGPNCEPPRA